jgi:hypothetical protein
MIFHRKRRTARSSIAGALLLRGVTKMRFCGAVVLSCIAGLTFVVSAQLANAEAGGPAAGVADNPVEKKPLPVTDAVAQPPNAAAPAGKPPIGNVASDHRINMGFLILATAILLIGVAVLLYVTSINPGDPFILKLGPSFFFWLSMGYTGLLLLMALAYNDRHGSEAPQLFGGILPVAVPWFGALGAVTISLEGVFLWNDTWKAKYNYWHIGRPLFGAVLAIVAFFLFVVIVTAAGTPPKLLQSPPDATAKDFIIFYVLAFLVGYREETFRELIKRATDVIMRPSVQPSPLPAVTLKVGGVMQSRVALPTTAAAQTSRVTVDLQNSGDAPLVAPTVALTPTTPTGPGTIVIANDQVTGRGDLAPGHSRVFELTFTPPAAGPFSGVLTVTATNLPTAKIIAVSGTGQ